MTFPSVVATTNGDKSSSVTSWTGITYPGSISANNILLLAVSGSAAGTFSGLPSGWAVLQQTAYTPPGETISLCLHWKRATGSETGTFTMTSSVSQRGVWYMLNIDGTHASTDPEIATAVTNSAASINTPSLDPTNWDVADTLWYAFCAHDSSSANRNITSYPLTDGQFTQKSSDTSSLGSGLAACRTNSATSSLDPENFVLQVSDDMVATLVAIRPTSTDLTLQIPLLAIPGLSQEPTHKIIFVFSVANITATATINAPTVLQNILLPPVINASATMFAPGVFHVVTTTRSVVQSSDDGHQSSTGSVDLTNAHMIMGGGAFGPGHIGIRFQDVRIPGNTTITNAAITLRLTETSKNDAEGNWSCQLAANPVTFTTATNDMSARTKTNALVSWTTNDLGNAGTDTTTPNLRTCVEEVVNTLGEWIPGNAMVFLYNHQSSTDAIQVASFDNTTDPEPSISISYLTTITVVSVDNKITPATTMYAPSVANTAGVIAPDAIVVSTTMYDPTVALGNVFLDMPGITVSFFMNDIAVIAPASGLQVLFQDDPQTASIAEPVFSDEVQDTAQTVEFQDSNTASLEDD